MRVLGSCCFDKWNKHQEEVPTKVNIEFVALEFHKPEDITIDCQSTSPSPFEGH